MAGVVVVFVVGVVVEVVVCPLELDVFCPLLVGVHMVDDEGCQGVVGGGVVVGAGVGEVVGEVGREIGVADCVGVDGVDTNPSASFNFAMVQGPTWPRLVLEDGSPSLVWKLATAD